MSNLVSIITPVYNSEKYLKDTIESVINQVFDNWELIIVDDCSQDMSRQIIEKYLNLDKRIKLISLDKNKGVAVARNIGIKAAKGRYIAFLDSDDLWFPEKLEKQVSFMLKKNAAISFTAYEMIDDSGKRLNRIVSVPPLVDYYRLLKENIMGCFTVMIDREKIKNIEMPVIKHEDYATWLKILKNNVKAHGLNEVLGYYRKVNNSISANKYKSAKWVWNIYRNVEGLSLLHSYYYFLNYSIRGIMKHYF